MKKWDRKYMSLEHPVVPESKEVFKKKKEKKICWWGLCPKGTGAKSKSFK